MGFFRSLFGGSKGSDESRYISEVDFREILRKQTTMSPLTVAQLYKLGVTDSTFLKLEFFFYTDAIVKAEQLANSLKQLNYTADAKISAHDAKLSLITGWTVPIRMDKSHVTNWTEKMCRLGFDHDCEFDGWGTNPKQ